MPLMESEPGAHAVSSLAKQPRGEGPEAKVTQTQGRALLSSTDTSVATEEKVKKLCGQEGQWGSPKRVVYWASDEQPQCEHGVRAVAGGVHRPELGGSSCASPNHRKTRVEVLDPTTQNDLIWKQGPCRCN